MSILTRYRKQVRVIVDGGDLIAVLSTAKLICDQRSYCVPQKGSVAAENSANGITLSAAYYLPR